MPCKGAYLVDDGEFLKSFKQGSGMVVKKGINRVGMRLGAEIGVQKIS